MHAENCSVKDFAVWAKSELEQANLYYGHGCEDAEDEGLWLASFIADFNYADFEGGWDRRLNDGQINRGRELLKQRIETQKPLAYLINQIWFAGHRFFIDERALVPRSHLGEWIVDCFEPWIDSNRVKSILDLCCGGGSIGVSAALHFDQVKVDLADLSKSALEVSERNINDYQLQQRVKTIESDLFSNIDSRYDLILCNPPYVSHINMEKLPQEYRYEPEMALVAGDEGLDSIAIILNQAEQHLTESGHLILEAGTAAPALESALDQVPLNWMMSASGESVVLIINKEELIQYRNRIKQLVN